ncbi:hypothetical protein EJ08DRAFT_662166 [Tothia fuscella]|uniref:Rhamnogalacturonase A/B/Epimerase-like pectate lyase domain-containing protein n=1 Tax=Tothia fuscella TaxID=1048955 RepID=A0A9P4NP06_9PEZI|nr:hypothetical protein EJ08DRAFT_662166 [Tothia fuscella]
MKYWLTFYPLLGASFVYSSLISHTLGSVGLEHQPIHRRGIPLLRRQENSTVLTPTFGVVSQTDISKARALIESRLQAWGQYNKAKFDTPLRNKYTLAPESESTLQSRSIKHPEITPDIARASALLAELDAASKVSPGNATSNNATYGNGTDHNTYGNITYSVLATGKPSAMASFWMEDIPRVGSQPYGNDASYKVFRNVKSPEFNAVGNGQVDDTEAINKAIRAGNRCGEKYYSSTTKNAISACVKYEPKIKTHEALLDVNHGMEEVALDETRTKFNRPISTGKSAISKSTYLEAQIPKALPLLRTEAGDSSVISHLKEGYYGIHGGNQQFTAHRLSFQNVKTAVWLIWDWGWTWKSIRIKDCETGFDLTSEHGKYSETGSILVQDSVFENVQNAIRTYGVPANIDSNNTGIALDNVAFRNTKAAVIDKSGVVWLNGNVGAVDTWIEGSFYKETSKRDWTIDDRSGAKGDGVTDDTARFQSVLDNNVGKIIFINAGSYKLTHTITVPPGSKIVGELWAQLVAEGNNFAVETNPRPLFRVGKPGDKGSGEIQDLLFTSKGATPGLISVQWNIEADKPGSAAMWDSHVRIGGATGSQLISKECPPLTSLGSGTGCKGGFLMVHITKEASAYIENAWLWTADHGLILGDEREGIAFKVPSDLTRAPHAPTAIEDMYE